MDSNFKEMDRPKAATIVDWSILVIALAWLATAPKSLSGDGQARFEALKTIITHGQLPDIKYSLLVSVAAIPVYFIGVLFNDPVGFVGYTNLVIFYITVLTLFFLLRQETNAGLLRSILILFTMGSMMTHHVHLLYGEVLSCCLLAVGVVMCARGMAVSAGLPIALSVANQPALIPGTILGMLYIGWRTRSSRPAVGIIMGILLIGIENYLKRGSVFRSGYEHDGGFETIMPYSGLPGFSYPLFFGTIAVVFSFGKGLIWFAPGLFLPWNHAGADIPKPLRLIVRAALLIVLGMVVIYGQWWSWYGGLFWGPRFFLFTCLPASIILAYALEHGRGSEWRSLLVLSILALSLWVGYNGVTFGLRNMAFLADNNYALEYLNWYVPEFSVLWKPFIDGFNLDFRQRLHLAFYIVVFLWLGRRHWQLLYKQLSTRMKRLRAWPAALILSMSSVIHAETDSGTTVLTRPEFGKPWTVPGVDMEFVAIAAGGFIMGSDRGKDDERPPHKVTISNRFWIGKYEVTQTEYTKVTDENPSFRFGKRRPVSNVSWFDATRFCVLLTLREQMANRLPEDYCFRLPTEAEWEFVCRAGTATEFSFGDDPELLHQHANYCDRSNVNPLPWKDNDHDDGFSRAANVGSFPPNPWGLFDLHGNVWEWCYDYFDPYPALELIDPCGPKTGFQKVIRGGSWYHAPAGCRSANRDGVDPISRDNDFGFRVVLGINLQKICSDHEDLQNAGTRNTNNKHSNQQDQ